MNLVELIQMLTNNPVLMLLLATGPFALIGYFCKTFPSGWLILVFGCACISSLLVLLNSNLYMLVLAIDFAIYIIAIVDVVQVPKATDFEVDRECLRVASLKKDHHVTMMVTNRSRRVHTLVIKDGLPQEFTGDPEEFELRMKPKSRISLNYEFKATGRGAFDIDAIHIRAQSRLGLWYRYLVYPCNTAIHVYPDMKQMSEYALLARTNRLSLVGVRRTRRIGQDNDFERLRDYTLDDNYKHIDWRSTARRNKLTVKDFQTSQSQRVIFLLDCGRMMTNVADGINLLDHSLNAILMLSYVALERGDSVGLITFSDKVHSFVPARGGRSQMNQLLHASFDRFPELVESRYNEAFLYLNSRCRKRSLVVLVTNIIDDVNARQIQEHLTQITGRHLPIGIFLRDHQLFDAVKEQDTTDAGTGIYKSGAAAEIISWRKEAISDLQRKGVFSLDVFPENMTAPLINQYLEIKARNLL